MKTLPNKIYMIQWNMGGFIHDKVYELELSKDRIYPTYWDKSGNFGGITKRDLRGYLDKRVDTRNGGCYQFYTSSLDTARAVLLGAKTTKEFLKKFVK